MTRPRTGSCVSSGISAHARVPRVSARRSRLHVRAQASENPFVKIGSQLVKAGSQLTETLTGTTRVAKKNNVDDNIVFVAGATGRLGARIVRECLLAGYTVRAGVRSVEKGNDLIETAKQYEVLTAQQLKRIQLIEYDLFDTDTIAPAIGNAACVVSAIGAPEDKPFDTSGPRKIDGEAAIALVEEAKRCGVKRFIMITSLGTTKFGWPASALNLFWGVLYWKKQAENALIRSGMAYTIVRPGGMERPTDTYKETHNTVLYPRDTQFGGQVSRLQVAEVVGVCVSEPELSGNKTIEVIASDAIPPQPLTDLLDGIQAEISLEEMAEKQAAIADVRNRKTSLAGEAEELEAQLAEAEERKVLAEQAFSLARGSLQEIRSMASGAEREAADVRSTVESLREQLTATQRQEAAAKAVLDAQRRSQRDGELLSSEDIRSITEPILNPRDGDATPNAAAGGGLFGGLFGGAKAKAAEEVEEEEEESTKIVTKPRGGFGSLFGGPANVAAVEEEPEEEEEEESTKVVTKPRGGFGGLFGGGGWKEEPKAEEAPPAPKAAPKAEPEKARESDTAKVVKGGGLFGLFQQDTVYADEAEAVDAAPPPAEVIERAVTKKGSGRKSVKELLGKQGGGDAAKAAPEPAAAPKAEAPKPPAPKPPAPKPAVPKPPPARKAAEPAGDGDLAAKRSAAVAAALSNLGAAADKVDSGAQVAADKAADAAEGVAKKTDTAVKEAAMSVENGASGAADAKAEAQEWISQWRAKQKVKVKA